MSSLYGPYPRYRLYTRPGDYVRTAAALLKQSPGEDCSGLTDALERRLGGHVIPLPMARTGIYLVIKDLIEPGQEVILSPYTIADVVNMVICAGGNPVFADLEPGTCNLDAAEVDRLITANTGCVLVTHFNGLICDMKALTAICDRHGVPLVEDAAQAFGARRMDTWAGTFGTAGIYSFGLYKNLTSFLGGAIVTRDESLAEKLRQSIATFPVQSKGSLAKKAFEGLQADIVTHPFFFGGAFFWLFRFAYLNNIGAINNRLKIDIDPKLKVTIPDEYLRRLSEVQSDIVLRQLDVVDSQTNARRTIAERYDDGLRNIGELTLPPIVDDGSHAYWHYAPIIRQEPETTRKALTAHVMRQGRDLAESHHRNCADLPCFEAWARDCPIARETAAGVVFLPCYPGLPMSHVDALIASIRDFFGA